MQDAYARPDLLHWLWYAYGGRLPERFHTWVHHDVICRTWVLRHFARSVVQITLPAIILMVALPAPLSVRILMTTYVVLGYVLLCSLIIVPSSEKRLLKAGHRPWSATEERAKRAVEDQHRTAQAHRDRVAARAAARARRYGS